MLLIPDRSTIQSLISLYSTAEWLTYTMTVSGLLWTRYKRPELHRPFRVSGTGCNIHPVPVQKSPVVKQNDQLPEKRFDYFCYGGLHLTVMKLVILFYAYDKGLPPTRGKL